MRSSVPDATELKTRLEVARSVAEAVGQFLMERHGRPVESAEKPGAGISIPIDAEGERIARQELSARFPDDAIQGEEFAPTPGTSGYTWIIDPLDGTTNYSLGLPTFAVAIACLLEREPVAAVVHAPMLGYQYAASLGSGAFQGDWRIQVRQTQDLRRSVFMINKAYHPIERLLAVALPLMTRLRTYRTFGCVSLDLCLAAEGRVDGILLLPTSVWDFAAGLLVLREAGARIHSNAGVIERPVLEASTRLGILAANPTLSDAAAAHVRWEMIDDESSDE
jgi:myo-inositol-1(or 4)-monophosphatase